MEMKTIVLGVIGADVHAVGNRILAYAFEQAGFRVVNLGVMVQQEEYVAAAVETAADVIMVSSLYGHGEMDCRGLREKCDEAGLEGILMYVGGNLVVGKQDFAEVERKFHGMGFDRVYPPGTSPDAAIEDLNRDLQQESKSDPSVNLDENLHMAPNRNLLTVPDRDLDKEPEGG